jgi:hypothetical protein
MKNAFSRIGQTCVFGVLMAGAMLAASIGRVTVTLPQAVAVGSTTLPSGEYTLSPVDMSDDNEYFVIRSEHGPAISLTARKIDAQETGGKTEVTLQKEGDTWHLDKLFVLGSSVGYQFTGR